MMQFINLHLDQTPDGKYIVTDNISSLRGEGETIEQAIGSYIFKAFCEAQVKEPGTLTVSSIGFLDSGFSFSECEHEWQTLYEYTGG